ncbi:hypothetical protein Bca101_058028 [Brassica carinata]
MFAKKTEIETIDNPLICKNNKRLKTNWMLFNMQPTIQVADDESVRMNERSVRLK